MLLKQFSILSLTLLQAIGLTGKYHSQNLDIIPEDAYLQARHDIPANSHYILKDLPANYVKDASVDYTFIIQAALKKYNNVVFPAFPLLINDSGLNIESNKNIYFLQGSELRMMPSIKKSFYILRIRGANHVNLYNPVLKGDRYQHLGTTGEWGMGLSILGSSNVKVFNARITECWGDGIYIADNEGIPCKNIQISNSSVSRNRRDGISVISVDGLKMENIYAGFSDGTKPLAGINFEPNDFKDELKNISLNKINTEANLGAGIQISMSNLYGGSNKTIGINISNHTDKGSERSFYSSIHLKKQVDDERVSGNIQINNANWIHNTFRPMVADLNEENIQLLLNNIQITDKNGKQYKGEAAKKFLSSKYYINPLSNYKISN